MEPTIEIPFDELARQLKLTSEQVTTATALLDAGHSVPFLALFRLDETHGLGEGSLVRLAERVEEYRQLQKRKTGLRDYLRHRDALDSQVQGEIDSADSKEQVDQLYAIYKRTRPPKGTLELIEPVSNVAKRVIQNTIDSAELETEYARLAAECEAFSSIDDVRVAIREHLVQHIAHSVPLRVLALRIMRETGSFECQRFHEAHEADPQCDASQVTSTEPREHADHSAAEPGSAAGPATPEHSGSSTESLVATDDRQASPAEADATATSTAAQPQRDPQDAGESSRQDVAEGMTDESSPSAKDMEQAAPERTTGSEDANTDGRQAEQTSTKAAAATTTSKAPSSRKSSVSLADERRHKRKQARMRRRAHLESALKDYFNKSFPIQKLSVHQFADIDYGERVRILSARVTYDEARLDEAAASMLIPETSSHGVLLRAAWADAKLRYVLADCERIVRREFSERMEQQVIQAVKRHVRAMCMQRPLTAPLLAISAHRDGFSLVAVDQGGRILASRDLSRNEFGPDRIRQEIKDTVEQHGLSYVVVEAAERTRLIQQMLADSLGDELKQRNVGWLTVADEGLANYCRSATGCEEIPGVSPEQRAAIALARRAQDPLSEFVKVEPRDWLSEQQQTTINVQRLRAEIEGVYQSCLARIGVDANLAEPSVLRKLPGLDELTARKIEAHRIAHGPFASISQLCQLLESAAGISEFIGYVRIKNGDEPLDAVGVHPDHYPLAEKLLGECGISKQQLAAEVAAGQAPTAGGAGEAPAAAAMSEAPESIAAPSQVANRDDWDRPFRTLEFQQLGELLEITREHARRLVNELRYAGRDVRENSRLPVVRYGSLKSESFQPGEMLAGRVVNTTSFGAFVEVAPGTVGLIHVSRLGDSYVRDPRQVLMEGERIPVWILSVDRERNRIALSLSPPGTQRPGRSGPTSRKRQAEQVGSSTLSRTAKSRSRSGPHRERQQAPRQRKPKPVVPLTEGMKSGREPMRTFGDLKQFFEIKSTPHKKSSQKKSEDRDQGDDDAN